MWGADAPWRTERAAAKPQTFHGHGTPLRGDGRSGEPGLFGLIATKGGGTGSNLCGSSKLLNL